MEINPVRASGITAQEKIIDVRFWMIRTQLKAQNQTIYSNNWMKLLTINQHKRFSQNKILMRSHRLNSSHTKI